MIKVLLICDRKNWAYDSIAKALVKCNTEAELSFEIFYMKGNERSFKSISRDYDLLFFLGWQLILEERKRFLGKKIVYKKRFNFVEDKRMLTGIHSHHAWDNRATEPDKNVLPPKMLIKSLNNYRAVNAVSFRLYSLFKEAGLHKVSYTPNGVDTEIFKPVKSLRRDGKLRVGYSGSLKHDWRKGITGFIQPACAKAGTELKKAMPVDNHYVPFESMPRFYNEIDVYLCASSSEGFSLSVLEASACGRPVISTRVGGCENLIINGENGFLVDRNVDAFVEKLKLLKENRNLLIQMGQKNQEIVEKNWSWKVRVKDWLNFIASNFKWRSCNEFKRRRVCLRK